MSTNTDAALGFNAYVYDRYATTGNANHNSSKFIDTGSLALLTGRAIGGAVAAEDPEVPRVQLPVDAGIRDGFPLHAADRVRGRSEGLPDESLVQITDHRVRLVGLHEAEGDRIVARLACSAVDGCTSEIGLPDGVVDVRRSTYWGDLLERLEVSDGRVQLAFDGAGAQAIAFSVPS